MLDEDMGCQKTNNIRCDSAPWQDIEFVEKFRIHCISIIANKITRKESTLS